MPHRSSCLYHISKSTIISLPKKTPTRTVSRAAKKPQNHSSPKRLVQYQFARPYPPPPLHLCSARAGIMRQEVALTILPLPPQHHGLVWYVRTATLPSSTVVPAWPRRLLDKKYPRRCVSNFTLYNPHPPSNPTPLQTTHLVFWGTDIGRSESGWVGSMALRPWGCEFAEGVCALRR